jgi:hypothetical protein
LYVAESISENGNTSAESAFDSILGLSSSVPGPALASSKSAVAVGLAGHAGPDGGFDEREVRVLGETFIHESGHYLGLFHPVEIASSGRYRGRDPLGDTPVCRNEADCIEEGVAANAMFPRPIGEINQIHLSPEQSQVLNLQVLVD